MSLIVSIWGGGEGVLKKTYPKPSKNDVFSVVFLFFFFLPAKLLFETRERIVEVPDLARFNECKRTVRKLSRVLYVRNRVLKSAMRFNTTAYSAGIAGGTWNSSGV